MLARDREWSSLFRGREKRVRLVGWASSYLKATGGVVVDLGGSVVSVTSPCVFDLFRPKIRKRSEGDEDNGDSVCVKGEGFGGELETTLTGFGDGLCWRTASRCKSWESRMTCARKSHGSGASAVHLECAMRLHSVQNTALFLTG